MFLVISILFWCNSSPKPNSPSKYEILEFRFSALLKIGLNSSQGFPYESSSHTVYKVLYVNRFCSFYCYYYYYYYYYYCYQCLVILQFCEYCDIVLYVDHGPCMLLKEYVPCLFCLLVQRKIPATYATSASLTLVPQV